MGDEGEVQGAGGAPQLSRAEARAVTDHGANRSTSRSLDAVLDHWVLQMRERGLRCVLVMSMPMTKQMGCPVIKYAVPVSTSWRGRGAFC